MSTRVIPLLSLTSAPERATAGGRYTSLYDTRDLSQLTCTLTSWTDLSPTSPKLFLNTQFQYFKTLNYELSLRHRASLRRYDESDTPVRKRSPLSSKLQIKLFLGAPIVFLRVTSYIRKPLPRQRDIAPEQFICRHSKDNKILLVTMQASLCATSCQRHPTPPSPTCRQGCTQGKILKDYHVNVK